MVAAEKTESRRLAALRRYEILDTPPDGAFDGITSLAAKLLRVPIALTTLVDTDRIWFKSRHGLELEQIGRDPGLCASAILKSEPYVVEDARVDPRTLANPLVAGEFGLQFYAAVPLTTHDSHNLGTLCVIDKEPRKLGADDLEILQTLADLVVDQMELRLASREVAKVNDELRAISEERQGFLAIASHDLRNPLNSVMMLGKLLAEQNAGPLNDKQEQMVARICESSDLMLDLVDDYLEYTAVESGNLKLDLEAVDLHALVETTLRSFEPQATGKSIQLEFETGEDAAGIRATLDVSRIKQALSNLISNAIKFSPKGKAVRVGCREESGLAVVTIRDEGQGVPESEYERLFKPFSLTSSRPTDSEKSTGLGLSIAKRLVDAHGGEIGFENRDGSGATFFIKLPLEAS
ncbi:MAG: GAF domain-containing sensor histidine kinase [Luteolibacter sp.]